MPSCRLILTVQGTGQCPAEKPRLARSLRKMGRTLTCPLSRPCTISCKFTNFWAKTGRISRISLVKVRYLCKSRTFGAWKWQNGVQKSPQLTAVRSDEGL